MHLFDVKRQKLFANLTSSEESLSISDSVDYYLLENRKKKWIDFFDEYNHSYIVYYEFSIEALEALFEFNDLIKTQTEFELQLSFEFYKKLFSLKKRLYFNSIESAQKFLVLSLIYSKYHSLFLTSIEPILNKIENIICARDIDVLFCKLLVRYETPKLIVTNFHNHEIFPIKPSKQEFFSIMTLSDVYFPFDNHILLRIFAIVKLSFFCNDLAFVSNFTRISKEFQNNPEKFLRQIDFWSRAMTLTFGAWGIPHFSITDTIDYLEHMRFLSKDTFSLKGRTPTTLNRAAQIWHGRVYSDDHTFLRKFKWTGLPKELDLFFTFKQNEYKCVQLKSGEELYLEGEAMQHCVITYAQSSRRYHCTIWSLQIKNKDSFSRILTIEVREKVIVQARKLRNNVPKKKDMEVLKEWAERMGYKIDLYKND